MEQCSPHYKQKHPEKPPMSSLKSRKKDSSMLLRRRGKEKERIPFHSWPCHQLEGRPCYHMGI
jgi:hypothetical protein